LSLVEVHLSGRQLSESVRITAAKEFAMADKIPQLREKIDYLLEKHVRQQKWLADTLLGESVSGENRSNTIGNWKNEGKIGKVHLEKFLSLFNITRQVLNNSDFDEFKRLVDASMVPGSGLPWKRLVELAQEPSDGLQLERPQRRVVTQPLGNLAFPGYGHSSPPRLPQVPQNEPVRLAIPVKTLDHLTTRAGRRFSKEDLVLCSEDRLGWTTLCPHPVQPGFVLDDNRWVIPGPDRQAFKLNGLGHFRAVVVIVGAALPGFVVDGLCRDKSIVGTDIFSNWLMREEVPFVVFQREFLVIAPAGPEHA
jgi:hypothetical protein